MPDARGRGSRPLPRPSALALTVLLALLLVPAGAAPARAHGAVGQEATDYLSELTTPAEPAPGVRVALVETGARLELTSLVDEVLVRGYDGEPFLRVGPAGVFTNTRSPAGVRSAVLDDPGGVPAGTDPAAPPEWVRTGDGPTARWYEHRARWSARDPPAAVAADPERRQVVRDWSVPVELADTGAPVPVAGTLTWVPGPPAGPWWLLALGSGAAVLALALAVRRAARPLAVVTAACVAVSVAHAGLSAAQAAGGPGAQLGAFATGNLALVAGWVAGAWGAVGLWRGRATGLYVAAFGGAVMAVVGGLLDAAAFGASQVPVAGPPLLGRLTTSLSLGLGLGIVAAAVAADERVAPAGPAGPAGPPGPEQDGQPAAPPDRSPEAAGASSPGPRPSGPQPSDPEPSDPELSDPELSEPGPSEPGPSDPRRPGPSVSDSGSDAPSGAVVLRPTRPGGSDSRDTAAVDSAATPSPSTSSRPGGG